MKSYLVFTTDLALAPLNGENTRGGRFFDFDNLDKARDFSKLEKDKWDRVFIFKRTQDGELERIEHYLRGQKYIGNERVRNG